jgi:hypothetical protein
MYRCIPAVLLMDKIETKEIDRNAVLATRRVIEAIGAREYPITLNSVKKVCKITLQSVICLK